VPPLRTWRAATWRPIQRKPPQLLETPVFAAHNSLGHPASSTPRTRRIAGMQTVLLKPPLLQTTSSLAIPLRSCRIAAQLRAPLQYHRQRWNSSSAPAEEPRSGTATQPPLISEPVARQSKSPFYFEAGYALFAKRRSKPFPPPFLSRPSGSFSDPLSTHNRSRDRRPHVNGEPIRGITNGDDAVLVSERFIAANDGVGAWATREKGHAAYGYANAS
jgi:hypothetical protein